jgi:muskelin
MCINNEQGLIYLLGGWDGQKSLDDFWEYDIKRDKWRILSACTSKENNGPGARSCHKMVYDAKTGCIYLLGRLSDMDSVKQQSEPVGDGVHLFDSNETNVPARQSDNGITGATGTTAFCSEFYRYHTRGLDAGKWDLLSFDTAVSRHLTSTTICSLTLERKQVGRRPTADVRSSNGDGLRRTNPLCIRRSGRRR